MEQTFKFFGPPPTRKSPPSLEIVHEKAVSISFQEAYNAFQYSADAEEELAAKYIDFYGSGAILRMFSNIEKPFASTPTKDLAVPAPLYSEEIYKAFVDKTAKVFELSPYNAVLFANWAFKSQKETNKSFEETDEAWEKMMLFVVQEKRALYRSINLAVDSSKKPQSLHTICKAIKNEISVDTYCTSLLQVFQNLCEAPCPPELTSITIHQTWAKQRLLEEQSILETFFLCISDLELPNASVLLDLLQCITKIEWGTRQEAYETLIGSAGGSQLVNTVRALLHLCATTCIVSSDVLVPGEILNGPTSIPQFDTIMQITLEINDLFTKLPQSTAPILLAWGLALAKFSSTFAGQIPSSPSDLSIIFSPDFQSHTFTSSLPPCLSEMASLLQSPLFITGQPQLLTSFVGMISNLVLLVPTVFPAAQWSPNLFQGVAEVLGILFQLPAARYLREDLCRIEWSMDPSPTTGTPNSRKTAVIIALGVERFPITVMSLLHIFVGIITGARIDQDLYGSSILLDHLRKGFWGLLGSLSAFTTVIDGSMLGPNSNAKSCMLGSGFPISPSVEIPAQTHGSVVSAQSSEAPVVKWNTEVNAWVLFLDLLADFGGLENATQMRHTLWTSEQEQLDGLALILNLLNQVLVGDPYRVTELPSKVSLVDAITTTLRKALYIFNNHSEELTAVPLISSCTQLLATLLPVHSDAIYAALSDPSFLFSTHKGGYIGHHKFNCNHPHSIQVINNIFGLLVALIHDYQFVVTLPTSTPEFKTMVMRQSLTWILENVWSYFDNWYCGDENVKMAFGRDIIGLFSDVLDAGLLATEYPLADFLLDALVYQSDALILTPLLHTIRDLQPSFSLSSTYVDRLTGSLTVIRKLIKLRRTRYRPMSNLECTLLQPDDSETYFTKLSSVIGSKLPLQVHTQAFNLLTVLALSASEIPPPIPNFVALLGGLDKAEVMAKKLVTFCEETTAGSKALGAAWNYLAAIVSSQPGFTFILAKKRSEKNIVESAMDGVGHWKKFWTKRPIAIFYLLRFLDFYCQQPGLSDTPDASISSDKKEFWQELLDILIDETSKSDESIACYQLASKAHAIRILASFIQDEYSKDSKLRYPLQQIIQSKESLWNALKHTVSFQFKPEIESELPDILTLAAYLSTTLHPLEDDRQYGSHFALPSKYVARIRDQYSSSVASRRAGFDVDDHLGALAKVNLELSKRECVVLFAESWRALLHTVVPLSYHHSLVAVSCTGVAAIFTQECRKTQRTIISEAPFEENLSVISLLTQASLYLNAEQMKHAMEDYLPPLGSLMTHDQFKVVASVAESAPFHRPLFKICYFLFLRWIDLQCTSSTFSEACIQATNRILLQLFEATSAIFRVAEDTQNPALTSMDMNLLVSTISFVLKSGILSSQAWWDSCRRSFIFQHAIDVFIRMDVFNGEYVYSEKAIDFFMAIISSSQDASDRLWDVGLWTALMNNGISSQISEDRLVDSINGVRTSAHKIWCGILLIMVTVGAYKQSKLTDGQLAGFVQLYSVRLTKALSWSSESSLSTPLLEEIVFSFDLIQFAYKRSSVRGTLSPILVERVTSSNELREEFKNLLLGDSNIDTK